ncbi:MAG TPA: hypothetical protein VG733_17095 [Chthoniobacteraceae bacterium]|nr:hypothetical protein [Chthoniobacteraceae bacterium]
MKLGKEDIQKIFLGVLLMIGLLYVYFNILLAPLATAEAAAATDIDTRGAQLKANEEAIRNQRALKTKADEAQATLEKVNALIPGGSPVAWFPPQAIEFFKRQGIEKCAVHRGEESTDKDLVGFKELSWGLDVSHVEVGPLAAAIAAFENEHPLMEIDSLQIQSGKDNVQYQTVRLNVSTVIKQ